MITPGTTTQAGINSITRDFADADLFRGMLKLDQGNMGQYDFMVGGYAMFKWVTMPTFMELGAPDLTKRFRNLTEKGSTSFEGINDISLQTEDVTGGYAGNTFKQVTNMKEEFDTFSMKLYEMNGSPIREAISYWANGIRDKGYGIAHYHGLVDTIEGGYTAKNHTAELIYIVTNPSLSYNAIEYACLITNIVPTKIPMSHLNYSHGEHPLVNFDLEFSGTKYESKFINEKAVEILKNYRDLQSYMDFKPKSLDLV
jgi:hypothetical protein